MDTTIRKLAISLALGLGITMVLATLVALHSQSSNSATKPGTTATPNPTVTVPPNGSPPAVFTAPPTQGPTPASSASLTGSHNPVVDSDCPDPGVVPVTSGGSTTYYLACTSDTLPAFPIRSSSDLLHWSAPVGYIFTAQQHPLWASGNYWAPEIHQIGGQFVAYFTARSTAGILSIGVATAPTVTGPYTDIGHPLITRDSQPGLIDPTVFTDSNGRMYLYDKLDGNAVGQPTQIMVQTLASNGLSTTSSSTVVLSDDAAWEAGITEGPFVTKHAGAYYLFFGAGSYASLNAAMGVARSTSPISPFVDDPQNPVLAQNGTFGGPGGPSVVSYQGEDVMIYHAYESSNQSRGRLVLADIITWNASGWPTINNGTPTT